MSTGITGATSVVNTQQTNQVVDPKDAKVGTGSINSSGPAPLAQQAYQSVLAGLSQFTPKIGSSDAEAVLASVAVKMKEVMSENDTDRMVKDQETKRLALQDKTAKLEEAEKKIEEAASKGSNIWGRVALAFQAISAIALVAGGIAMCFIPSMQVTGAGMIASGSIMAVMAVDSTVKEFTGGTGIVGSIAKAGGADDKTVMALDLAFTCTLAVASVAVGLLSMGIGAGLALLTNAAANTAATVTSVTAASVSAGTSTGASAASTATTGAAVGASVVSNAAMASATISANTTASVVVAGSSGVGAVSGSVSAGAQVAQSVNNYETAEIRQDAAEANAEGSEISAAMQLLDDMVDQALASLMGSSERFAGMLDSITDMMKDRGDTLSQMKFSG